MDIVEPVVENIVRGPHACQGSGSLKQTGLNPNNCVELCPALDHVESIVCNTCGYEHQEALICTPGMGPRGSRGGRGCTWGIDYCGAHGGCQAWVAAL